MLAKTRRLYDKLMTGGISLVLLFSLTACPEAEKVLTSPEAAAESVADYGDAPDDRDDTGTVSGAKFPTKLASNGARHLDTTQSALGYFLADGSLPSSAEDDATDPSDPDGEPNLDENPDQDRYDDGLFIGLLPAGGQYQLPVVVSVAAGATDQLRYINVLADWNRDLEWNDATSTGTEEWVVKNHPVHVAPGTSERVLTPFATMGSQTHDIWYRVTLSERPIDESAYPDGWDGTGEFAEGETEDYYYQNIPMNEMEIDDTVYPPLFPPVLPPEDPDGPEDFNDPFDPDKLIDPDDDGDEPCPAPGDDDDADNPDPDGDGKPGIDKKNIGKLKKIGPNSYKLVICKGKTWYRGFKWQTSLRNGGNSNPFTAGVRMTNDPGTVAIRGRKVGTTTVTFEALTHTFPIANTDWVSGTIYVTVIDCEPKCEEEAAADPAGAPKKVPVVDPADPFAGLDNAGVEDLYKLRHAGDNVYYLVICICEEDMSWQRGFQYSTNVRNPQTDDDGVATIGLQNDPGSVTITPTGIGTTTVTFEADVNTFPHNEVKYETITIHIKVIQCPEDMMNVR